MSCPQSVPNQTTQDDSAENQNTPVHGVESWVVLLRPKRPEKQEEVPYASEPIIDGSKRLSKSPWPPFRTSMDATGARLIWSDPASAATP